MSGSGTVDFFYREAHRLGYVARSTFKFSFNYGWNLEVQLLQIQKEYKLITHGSSVVDLGCAPGAWLQGILGISLRILWRWLWISRHRFKKMGGFTRNEDFLTVQGGKRERTFLEYISFLMNSTPGLICEVIGLKSLLCGRP
uniref:rRNA methyltransferase 2, mitochondrial n=1 Tax=Lactuca sativa TaxID=4236 RepID=A0A9R1US12_LACSA|nr:hypothetical protein LSAT_V11C800416160 [Lactuca sativa]